jgi:uncharacterized protein YidB (DUF937 family)
MTDLVGEMMSGQSPDQQQNLLGSVAGLINHPQVGGISGLMRMFESRGLGHLMSAWIGNGPNPPVSAPQVQQVFGSQRIMEIAQKLGIDPNQAATQLAAILPHAVDHLTPNGAVPPAGTGSTQSMLASLMGRFMHA